MSSSAEPLALAVHDVAFLHWAVPAEQLRELLPPGTTPDVWDGSAYLGLVALRMVGVRPVGGPALPYLSTFPQVNVRTYVRDAEGRPGLIFLSMAASRLVPVLCGRLTLGLPYRWARVRVEHRAGLHAYDVTGRNESNERVALRIGQRVVEPSPLMTFLTERSALYQHFGGWTYRLANSHPPWPLYEAEAADAGANLAQEAVGGPPRLGAPVSALWSPGVRMRFGLPQRLRS